MPKIFSIVTFFLCFATSSFAQINTEKVMAIGRNALYFEDYVLSIQYFNQVIKVKPYMAEPYFYRAVAKINLNDYQGAEEDCTLCLERNPFIVKAYECRAIARQQLEDFDGAIVDYKKVLEYSPDNKGVMLNKAIAEAQLKNYDQSEKDYDVLLKRYPAYDAAYLSRGRMYVEKGDTVKAVADLDKAIELDKYSSYAYATRAMINYQREDYKGAADDYTEAIKLESSQPGFYVNRGLANFQLSDLRAAMADYDKAIDLDPDNVISRYNRGLLRAQVADNNRAIEDFDKVIELEPDNYLAYYNRAMLRVQTGDYRGAIRDYSTVIKEYPNYIPGYQARGQAKHLMGDAAGGDRDFMTAYRMEEKYKDDKRKGRIKEEDDETGLASNDSEDPDEKTRLQSDKNIRKFNRVVVASNDKFTEKYTNELRGRVQDKNVNVEILPSYVATYYEKPDPLKNRAYYNQVLIDFNKKNLLNNKLLSITNAEIPLTEEQIDQHFASINVYSKKIQDNPKNAVAYFARGIDFMLVQDFASAVEDFTRAVNLNDTLALAYFNRAVVMTKQLEYESASGEYDINQSKKVNLSSAFRVTQQSAGITPSEAVKNVNLDYEIIFKDYDKVIRLSPKFMYAYYNRANIRFMQKDFRNAVSDYNEAIKADPEFAEAYFNRGLTYVYLGENKKAIADLSKAGELGIVNAYNIIKRLSIAD